jgi:GTPase SAR1 family protein
MLIVIEGMDGTGKTTLANKIIERYPQFKYVHPVPSHGPEGMTGSYMVSEMLDIFRRVGIGENILTDRINLISDPIYGPICRGKCSFDYRNYNFVLKEFFEIKPLIIYCCPPANTILKNIRGSKQMAGVEYNWGKLLEAYNFLFANWNVLGVNFSAYDYTHSKEDQVFNYLEHYGVKR